MRDNSPARPRSQNKKSNNDHGEIHTYKTYLNVYYFSRHDGKMKRVDDQGGPQMFEPQSQSGSETVLWLEGLRPGIADHNYRASHVTVSHILLRVAFCHQPPLCVSGLP